MSEALLALDAELLGFEGAICVYVLPGGEPAVIDPGPATTLPTIERKLAEHGVRLSDLRHVVLTHIHLDHAGSSGLLLQRAPDAVLHVHRDGAPHMVDPTKLVSSTRRTFGEHHDRLWGEMTPVPADRVRPWQPGDRGPFNGLRAFPTPGHIDHHLAYLDERDGVLFSGDSMGIVLDDRAPTHPPTPPPSVDLAAWARSLESLAALRPERFGATHFGLHGRFEERRTMMAERLRALEDRVARAIDRGREEEDAELYERDVCEELAPFAGREPIERYFDVFGATNDWWGVHRYVVRKREREGT